MKLYLREDQVISLFNANLFELVDRDNTYADFKFERKYSFGKKYSISLCVNKAKVLRALEALREDNPPIDKVIISSIDKYAEELNDWHQNISRYGSKLEFLNVRNFKDLESNANWDIDFQKEMRKYKGEGEAYVSMLRTVSDRIAYLILEDKNNLWNIEWREFEKLMHSVFKEIGFKADLTTSAGDGGKDIICKLSNNSKNVYFIELKLHRSKIGNKPLEKMNELLKKKNDSDDGFTYEGIVISPMGFPKKISILHEPETKIRIGDFNKVVSLCKRFVQVKSGLFLPNEDFETIIKEDTKLI